MGQEFYVSDDVVSDFVDKLGLSLGWRSIAGLLSYTDHPRETAKGGTKCSA